MAETPPREIDVLVVGAGPTGLSLAIELTRHGARCRVVDQAAGPAEGSRAMAVQSRTLECFRVMGTADEVQSRGRSWRELSLYAGGSRLADFPINSADLDTPFPTGVLIPQSETERILGRHLATLGVEPERSTRLAALEQDGDGVTATLVDPAGGGHARTVRAGYVVGCDGAHSAVRHLLDLPFEGSAYEDKVLTADVTVDCDLPRDGAHIIYVTGGFVAAFSFPEEGKWRLVYSGEGTPEDADPGRTQAHFQRLLDANLPGKVVVHTPEQAAIYAIHHRLAGRFRSGRCFVAGDAAHIHSPAGGQGMNTGIQDAFNLAWKLALVARGAGRDALLDSFNAERRPVAEGVLRETDRGTRITMLKGPAAEEVRNALIHLAGGLGFARRALAHGVSELEVSYRGSPIVAEPHGSRLAAWLDADRRAFDAGPHAGDRAPDVVLGAARLFDLYRDPRHVLLLFGGADATAGLAASAGPYADRVAVHRAEVEPGPGRLADPEGALGRRYGASSPCFYLIRPDGYVGTRGHAGDVEMLRGHLGTLFA